MREICATLRNNDLNWGKRKAKDIRNLKKVKKQDTMEFANSRLTDQVCLFVCTGGK